METEVLRSQILNLRFKYLNNNINPICIRGFIPEDSTLIDYEQKLHIAENKTSQENSNISKSDINEAAKLFFTLFSCPSRYEKLYWEAIFGPKSRILLMASNILKQVEGEFKPKALDIFSKMCSVLRFQHISYYHEGNKSVGRHTELMRNILGVKGRIPSQTNTYFIFFL